MKQQHLLAASLLVALGGCNASDPALMQRIEALEARLAKQEDVESIRRVAYSYGYFMDNALLDQYVLTHQPKPNRAQRPRFVALDSRGVSP